MAALYQGILQAVCFVCLLTGAVITAPVSKYIYRSTPGTSGDMGLCMLIGFFFWMLIFVILLLFVLFHYLPWHIHVAIT